MDLKVIRGGKEDSILTSKKVFLKAFATNTRLMGVTAVHAIFSLPDNFILKTCHMFFYFDSEEFYFDTYEKVLSKSLNDPKVARYVDEISSRMMGGLGGSLIEISEKELKVLIKYYYDKTIDNHDDVPKGYEEYKFLIDKSISFSDKELSELFDKICVPISCDYEAINYFLMRLVGSDFLPAKYLTDGSFMLFNLGFNNGAFLKNKISELDSEMDIKNDDEYFNSFSTVKTYFTESLIESNDSFYIMTTEIRVCNLKIVGFKKLSSFKITNIEADMMTKRTEYLSLYEYSFPIELIPNFSTKLTKYTMTNYHENGILFMIFNKNNDHVKNKVFNISDDVLGVQYITKFNELILMAYSKETLKFLKKDLKSFSMYDDLQFIDDYTAKNPIFYSFVNSNYEGLQDFLDDSFN